LYTSNNYISRGTDIKILQYEQFAVERIDTIINLSCLLNQVLPVIMINIESDMLRYNSCMEELKKISATTVIHLKATFWKDRNTFKLDLNQILNFLSNFNETIVEKELTMDVFSKWNDSNIYIQDGPLACYCSHVRALIYGYYNFGNHFVVVEDDIYIANTKKIEKYITQVPEDWDIICLNANPINKIYKEKIYKFTSKFHSTHFYIINKKCLPTIFKNIYPITDQIDILISELYDKLNIYNITETVYQKNFSTNTQNNLHVIYNSPNYAYIRDRIKEMEDELLNYIDIQLPNNNNNNNYIRDTIICDVVYNYIINHTKNNKEVSLSLENKFNITEKLYNALCIIISSCVKGINEDIVVSELLNDINDIISCFKNHSDTMKAISYGSTSNVYRFGDLIYKTYNKHLRWTNIDHDNIDKIFEKEVSILQIINSEIIIQDKTIIMKYLGESLYNSFALPEDWRDQISNIFQILDKKNIYYPEFNLKNIVVLNNIISFVDYGLATINSNGNTKNCQVFLELLNILQTKMSNTFSKQQNIIYITFINNMKMEKKYTENIF